MDEKTIEALQKKSRRSYYFAAAFSATVFLAITSVLFFLLLTTPSGIAYLEESPKEMITGVIVLPALLAVGIYLLLYYLFVKTTYETFNQAFKGTYVLQIVETAGGFSNLSYSPVTQYLKRNGKKSEIRTIFSGQVMRFSLPNEFKWSFGHLQIFEKEFLSNLKGYTAPYKIQTENEAFNQRFEIFAADEHNAFYLLTPRMLEQIIRFADFANCQIALAFVGMALYVAVDRPHSMFNASVRQSLTKQRQLIFDDAILLKKAGEILLFGTDAHSNQEQP